MIQKRSNGNDDLFLNWADYRDGILTPEAANYWIGIKIQLNKVNNLRFV